MNKGIIRILVVADEETLLNAIKNICQEDFFELTTEISPTKALDIIKTERQFDILIVNYAMHGLTGIDLLRKVKLLYKRDSYIPMLCTGCGTTHFFQDEFKDLLFYYFLETPIDIALAKKTIGKAVYNIRLLRAGKGRGLGR